MKKKVRKKKNSKRIFKFLHSTLIVFKYILKTSSGEEELTGDEALSLIKTVDFYTKQIAKEAVLYVKIKIASNTIKDKFIDCGYMKVNMRILVGSGESKYYTERVLTLSFS